MELHLEVIIAQVVEPAPFTMYWVARQDTQSLTHTMQIFIYLFSNIQSDYYWLAENIHLIPEIHGLSVST